MAFFFFCTFIFIPLYSNTNEIRTNLQYQIKVIKGEVELWPSKQRIDSSSPLLIVDESVILFFLRNNSQISLELNSGSPKKVTILKNAKERDRVKDLYEKQVLKEINTNQMTLITLVPFSMIPQFFLFFAIFYFLLRKKKRARADILFYFPFIATAIFFLSALLSQAFLFKQHDRLYLTLFFSLGNIALLFLLDKYLIVYEITPEERELLADMKIAATFLSKGRPLTENEKKIILESSMPKNTKRKIMAYNKRLIAGKITNFEQITQ